MRYNFQVKTAIWLGAAIITYSKWKIAIDHGDEVDVDTFWLKQSEITVFCKGLTRQELNSARVSQWYNGDHPNHTHPYLRQQGPDRRLVATGEFEGCSIRPEGLPTAMIIECFCHGQAINISIGDLVEWVDQVYSPIIIENKRKAVENTWKIELSEEDDETVNNETQSVDDEDGLDLQKYVHQFMKQVRENKIEIYNEFSLKHELGIYLKKALGSQYKIQFERPIGFFGLEKSKFVKREIDMVIVEQDKKKKYAIDITFPKNGQYLEPMYGMVKGVKLIEQLQREGFTASYCLSVVEDRHFYSSNKEEYGIYALFRKSGVITGAINKPSGSENDLITISGKYPIQWLEAGNDRRYYLVENR